MHWSTAAAVCCLGLDSRLCLTWGERGGGAGGGGPSDRRVASSAAPGEVIHQLVHTLPAPDVWNTREGDGKGNHPRPAATTTTAAAAAATPAAIPRGGNAARRSAKASEQYDSCRPLPRLPRSRTVRDETPKLLRFCPCAVGSHLPMMCLYLRRWMAGNDRSVCRVSSDWRVNVSRRPRHSLSAAAPCTAGSYRVV